MTDPVSVYLTLRDDGALEAFRYARNLRTVKARLGARVAPARAEAWLRRAGEASARPQRPGDGLTQGDLFRLSVAANGRPLGEFSGFVEQSPASTRALVADLLGLVETAKELDRAEGYLRSIPLETGRFAELRGSKNLPWTSFEELSAGLRPALEKAITQPQEFVPLAGDSYRQAQARFSANQELFVVYRGAGHQVVLYHSAAVHGPP